MEATLRAQIKLLQNDLDQIRVATQRLVVTAGNWAAITQAQTTNGQGATAGGIIASINLVAKRTGNFMWWASASVPAAAPTDGAETFVVESQMGTGTVTRAGSGVCPGFAGSTAVSTGVVSTGVAGTPITITGGGGGALAQYTRTITLGIAAVGDTFSAFGFMENSITGGGNAFTIGNNVILNLKYSNVGAVNHPIAFINLGMMELTN